MTGKDVKKLRLQLGLTQAEFGRAMGFQGKAIAISIARIEAGNRAITPRMQKLMDMYRRHGVPEKSLRRVAISV